MILPVILGTLLYDVNSIIDKNFASFLSQGSISVLDYSYKVAGAAQGILAYPVTTVIYTQLADHSSKNDVDGLNVSIEQGFLRLSLIMIPVLSGMLCTSDLLIKLIFGRGEFSSESIKTTSICLILYLVGMYAISYRALFEKAFYSLKKTRITLINTTITVATNIFFDWLLYKKYQCYGLAMATSISLIISCIFLVVQLKHTTFLSLSKETKKSLIKIVVSSICMTVLIFGLRYIMILFQFKINEILELLIFVIAGIAFYFFMLFFLKESTIRIVTHDILNRRNKRV